MLADPGAALQAAKAAGVEHVVTIGIDAEISRGAVALAERYDMVSAAVALHPHDAEQWNDELPVTLSELAQHPKVVAIGECGLDYYRDLSPRDAQRRAFSAQIELARSCELPLVVHVREAGDEALEILAREASDLTVVLHCFALPEHVDECNRRGYYASFAGNLTFKNAAPLREAAAKVTPERLLVETDAPFLTPVPHRGHENAPALVKLTATCLAEQRGWSEEQVAEVTTANARRVFGLPAS